MKTPLALHNLWHQGAKTLVSIGGVAFALLLVFMQLGFMGAVSHTATNVLERLKFDLLIRGRDYLHLYEPGQVERKWLEVVDNTQGVARVDPFWITIQNWRKLPSGKEAEADSFESKYLPIAVMAFQPHDPPFDLPAIEEQTGALLLDDAVLLDNSTQADYGPLNGRRFTEDDVGRETEVGGKQFRVHGLFDLGTGLAANGALVMGDEGYARITPWDIRTSCSLGLVSLVDDDPVSKQQALQAIRQRLSIGETNAEPPVEPTAWQKLKGWFGAPETEYQAGVVDVMTREEAFEREKFRWLWQTPIGLIFQLGVLLSLLVGSAIVYMVLSTDVANRLPEYATLLAMGYSRRYLASIVMTQALVLCLFGFASAWGIAELLYRVTSVVSGIPLSMNMTRVILVATLGVFMCCVSGLLALRKLWKAEPANLF